MTARGKALEPAFRSKLERDYAAHLDARRAAGEIRAWWFEDVALRIGHDCRLHVDFMLQMPDDAIEFHETKGPHQREDSIVKLRAAAAKFPFVFRLVTLSKAGAWEIAEVGASTKRANEASAQKPDWVKAKIAWEIFVARLREQAAAAEGITTRSFLSSAATEVERLVAEVARLTVIETEQSVPGSRPGARIKCSRRAESGTSAAPQSERMATLNGKAIALADAMRMVRGE